VVFPHPLWVPAMRKAGISICCPSSHMNYESVLFKENLHTILTFLARLARLILFVLNKIYLEDGQPGSQQRQS
jgi:hypothetical protein